jgi:hypothetical protein
MRRKFRNSLLFSTGVAGLTDAVDPLDSTNPYVDVRSDTC